MYISQDITLLLEKMNKTILILLVSFVMPINAFADSGSLWNKLSMIADDGWEKVDLITGKELHQLISLSKSGDSNAQYALGMVYQVRHEHAKADSWLKRAAEQGHVPAHYSFNKNAEGHPDMASLNWE